jgi:putative flippase GtrA
VTGLFRSQQFIAFLITGGIAAIVNFGSRIVYDKWVSFSTAIIFAYITGMITAFVLARIFVFTDSNRALHLSAFFFVLVNIVAAAQTWIISIVLAQSLLPLIGVESHVREIAHAIGVIVPVFTSFIGHKYLSFRC